jgi:hypothetical protein
VGSEEGRREGGMEGGREERKKTIEEEDKGRSY